MAFVSVLMVIIANTYVISVWVYIFFVRELNRGLMIIKMMKKYRMIDIIFKLADGTIFENNFFFFSNPRVLKIY